MDTLLIVQSLPLIGVLAILGMVIHMGVKKSREEASQGAGITPGFKGWLLLLSIGVILAPLRLLTEMLKYYGNPDITAALQLLPIAIYTEAGLNAILLISALATAVYMVRKKKEFRIAFYVQYFISVIGLPASSLATSMALQLRGMQAQPLGEEGAMAIARWVIMVVIGGIWTAYVAKSRRVAVTFVN